jgi:hypothetical protein
MHLTSDELIELAEGSGTERARHHLVICEECRRQEAELEAILAVAREVDVPEPSPLYWDQFSARVRTAAEAEGRPRRLPALTWSWRSLAPVGAVVAAVLLAALYLTGRRPAPIGGPPTVTSATVSDAASLMPYGDSNDPSLAFVADLASQLDVDDAIESGLVTHTGGIDEAVVTMTTAERIELERLLKHELGKS